MGTIIDNQRRRKGGVIKTESRFLQTWKSNNAPEPTKITEMDRKNPKIVKISAKHSFKTNARFENIGQNVFVNGYMEQNGVKSSQTKVLLDTGAVFSCCSAAFLQRLKSQGITFKGIRSDRPEPGSAVNERMPIFGDIICCMVIISEEIRLEISDVKLSVIENLTCDLILGSEILEKIGFSLRGDRVSLANRGFPVIGNPSNIYKFGTNVISTTQSTHMPFVAELSAIDYDSPDGGDKPFESLLFTPHNEHSTADAYSTLASECLIKPAELQNRFNFIFNGDSEKLPKTITGKLEEVEIIGTIDKNFTGFIGKIAIPEDCKIDETIIKKLVKEADASEDQKRKLETVLTRNANVFSKSCDDVGHYKGESIDLKLKDPECEPIFIRPRRLPHAGKEWLSEKVKKMEELGIIEECSGSSFNAPVHLVKKKNGEYRLTIDYRGLNTLLRPNRYPIPRIPEIIESLSGSAYFSICDLRSGFWNIRLNKSSRDLTAFTVSQRQYQWRRLPMGLNISPGVFQHIMQKILRKHLGIRALVYLDDLLIYSKNAVEHLKDISMVLETLEKSGILLNPEKCVMMKTKIDYVGYTISEKGWQPQMRKIKAISNFPTPKNKTQAKSFVGMCSFYSSGIPKLQQTLGPIHDVSGKNFIWNAEQEDAIQKAKELLTNAAIVAYPSNDEKCTFYLSTDASDIGYGAALSQLSLNGIERPIGFMSGRFQGSSKNWSTREKEASSFGERIIEV